MDTQNPYVELGKTYINASAKIFLWTMVAAVVLFFAFNKAKVTAPINTKTINPEPNKPKIKIDPNGNIYLLNPEDFIKGSVIMVSVNGRDIEAFI